MKRRAIALSVVAILAIVPLAVASAAESKILGLRGLGDRYIGVESITSVQDPFMPVAAIWSAGPVGMTMWPDGPALVEGGTIKSFHSPSQQWKRSPFFTWGDTVGNIGHLRFYHIELAPAGYAKYSARRIGSNQSYRVTFCFGNAYQYCQDLLSSKHLGRSYFSHAAAGGEGLCGSGIGNRECPIGYIATTQNRFLSWYDNTWRTYCYTQTYNYTNGGTISACGPYPQPNWNVNFK